MAHRISIIAARHNGQSGWMLRWTDPAPVAYRTHTKLSHWFADVDEAMAVQFEMRNGASFEAALHDVMKATGCV